MKWQILKNMSFRSSVHCPAVQWKMNIEHLPFESDACWWNSEIHISIHHNLFHLLYECKQICRYYCEKHLCNYNKEIEVGTMRVSRAAKELSRGVQKLRLALCNLKLGWISSAWCNAGEQVQLCIASDSCPQICLKGELHHSVPSLQTGHPGATSPITAMTNEVREGIIENACLINCSCFS